mmetsp:Transcript_22139/g.31713  ORF Transcript_22139/g.31713 Transcript_22139/m.31713 type:complete len:209 (+) Transcript_22139:521-1147(+)
MDATTPWLERNCDDNISSSSSTSTRDAFFLATDLPRGLLLVVGLPILIVRFRLLIAAFDKSSLDEVSKSPKSMFSECSLFAEPNKPPSSSFSIFGGIEAVTDDRFILAALPPIVDGLKPLLLRAAGRCCCGAAVVTLSLLFSARSGSNPLKTSLTNLTEKIFRSPQILTVRLIFSAIDRSRLHARRNELPRTGLKASKYLFPLFLFDI